MNYAIDDTLYGDAPSLRESNKSYVDITCGCGCFEFPHYALAVGVGAANTQAFYSGKRGERGKRRRRIGLSHGIRVVAPSCCESKEVGVPTTITQILIIVAAVYVCAVVRRKVYDQMQRSDKPKSAIQQFPGW